MKRHNPTRRDLLKLAALDGGAIALRPIEKLAQTDFPQADMLGRISSGASYDTWGNRVNSWETPVGELSILRGGRRSGPHIWPRRCNTDPG